MKKLLIIGGVILIIFVVGILVIGRTYFPDNIAETAADGGTKDLKTRVYKTDLVSAAKDVQTVIPTLTSWGGSWKLIENKFEGDTATIMAEVPVVMFTDDLVVTLMQTEEGVMVNVRSNSRVGKSDFGENRRHVEQILEALDKKYAGQ